MYELKNARCTIQKKSVNVWSLNQRGDYMRPVRTGSGPSQIGIAEVYTGPGWKYWPVIKSYYNLLFIKVIYIRVDNGGKETLDRSDFEFGYTLGKLTYRPDSRPGEILSSAQQTDRVRPAWNIFCNDFHATRIEVEPAWFRTDVM